MGIKATQISPTKPEYRDPWKDLLLENACQNGCMKKAIHSDKAKRHAAGVGVGVG